VEVAAGQVGGRESRLSLLRLLADWCIGEMARADSFQAVRDLGVRRSSGGDQLINEFVAKRFAPRASVDDGRRTAVEDYGANELLNEVTVLHDAGHGHQIGPLAGLRGLIAAGFVDTPLSAELLGDQLDASREVLRTSLPILRVAGRHGALAVHLMANTAVTGATYDIDGGQQLL
jgi:hypothetical protein